LLLESDTGIFAESLPERAVFPKPRQRLGHSVGVFHRHDQPADFVLDKLRDGSDGC
jgi:hypothetical protein